MQNLLANIGLIPAIGGVLLFVAIVFIVVGSSSLLAEWSFFQRRLALGEIGAARPLRLADELDDRAIHAGAMA